jgi:hypothetical protein
MDDCPVCGGPMPDSDPRRRWCSAGCRTWIYRAGGPTKAAELKESWAEDWASLDQSDAKENADQCWRQAAALRRIVTKRR